MCVHVCESMRERVRESVCMSLRETETVRDNIYERESIRVSETETESVCMCVRETERKRSVRGK